MHLRAVKLLPLLCACFISPCILHPTPHTEFPFLVLWVFDFFPPLSILTLRFFRLTQLSQLSVFLLHAVSFLTLSVYPVKIRFPSWPEYAPIPISAQFIHCTFHLVLVSQFFFLNLHFFPSFFPCYFLYIRYLVQFVRADSLSESYQQSHCHSSIFQLPIRLRTC